MRQALEGMKEVTVLPDVVSIKSAPDENTWEELAKLVGKL